ncbi:MAG: hypothetical protein ABIN67_17645 [Ferruginibacter sp.]
MKNLLIILLYIFSVQTSLAQTDSVKIINEEYSQYIHNNFTKSENLSYNYSNKWDFDGDSKNDSLYFIGNGGAHTYFFLRIILSSDGLIRNFPTIQIDMPFFATIETLNKLGQNSSVQFVISDFDNNKTQDIYLNFNNPFGFIPKAWENKGVKTKNVLLSFAGTIISVKDYY